MLIAGVDQWGGGGGGGGGGSRVKKLGSNQIAIEIVGGGGGGGGRRGTYTDPLDPRFPLDLSLLTVLYAHHTNCLMLQGTHCCDPL